MIINIKKRDNSIIILFFLIFIPLPAITQQQETAKIKGTLIAKIDSCNNNLLQLDQEQKLMIISLANNTGEYNALSDFFKHKGLYGEYYQVLMNKHKIKKNLDSVYFYYKKADNHYRNNEKDTKLLRNTLSSDFIIWCLNLNYFEVAISILKQNVEYNSTLKNNNSYWTYHMLTQTLTSMGKYEQAIKTGKEALQSNNYNEKNFAIIQTAICAEIAGSCLALNDYTASLAYSDSVLKYVEKLPENQPLFADYSFRDLALIDAYTVKSVNYSYIGDFENALLMLQKVNTINNSKKSSKVVSINLDDMLTASKNWGYIVFHYQKGNYPKAMEYLNNSKKLSLTPALIPEYRNFPKWEALILKKMGRYEQANLALEELLHLTDSTNRANSTAEINSLWAIYEVDKAQQEIEKSKLKANKFYIISISTSIVVLISTILIVYFIVSNRKLKEKNRVLFKQQKGQLSPIPLINNNKKNTISEELPQISPLEVIPQNTEKVLYFEIIEYLQTTKQYTDPNISRELLAKELGTNRQYIIDAISNNAQMTFNEFINNFRINYARDLLLSEDNIMIKKVYTDAGFNSRSTFTVLFKEKFGMTPSEFRDCANEETK